MHLLKKAFTPFYKTTFYTPAAQFSNFVYPSKNYPFPNLNVLNDYISKQKNNVQLSEMLQFMLEENPKSVLSTFNTAYFVKHNTSMNQTSITKDLLNGMQTAKMDSFIQPFSQGKFLSLANTQYFRHKDTPHGLKEFGICEEITLAWYFLHFFKKDLVAEANQMIHALNTTQNLTTSQEKLLNMLREFQQSVGHRTFRFEDVYLQHSCVMEAYLRNAVRHRYTVALKEQSTYAFDCEAFVRKTFGAEVTPGALTLIRAGWQENDNLSERYHVFGYFSTQHEGQSFFHLFDSNREACVTNTADHACEKMSEYITSFMHRIRQNLPFSKFFLSSSTPYLVKNAALLKPESTEDQETKPASNIRQN